MFTAMLKGGYFDIDRYSWKWPSYEIKPIFGVVVDAHLVVILFEFIMYHAAESEILCTNLSEASFSANFDIRNKSVKKRRLA
mgnify:CR=1 FL=1